MGGERDDKGELLFVWKLDGTRFSKHGLDLRDLPALHALRKILVSTAVHLWAKDTGSRHDGLDEHVRLLFYKIHDGCANIPVYCRIDVAALIRLIEHDAATGQQTLPTIDRSAVEEQALGYIRDSVVITAENTNSLTRQESVQHDLPQEILGYYPEAFAGLVDDDSAELLIPAAPEIARSKQGESLPHIDGVPLVPIAVVRAEQRHRIAGATALATMPDAPEPSPPRLDEGDDTRRVASEYKLTARVIDVTTSTGRATILFMGKRISAWFSLKDRAAFMHACENQQTHEIRLEGTVSLDAKTDRVLAVKQVTHATSVEAPRPQLLMFADSASLQSRGGHGARMFVHVEPTSIRTVFPVTDAQVVHAGSYPSRAAEATSELLTGDHEVVMSDRQSVMAGTSGEPMSQQMSYTEAREYLDSGPGLAPIKELLEAGRVTEARRKVAAMLKTGGGVTPWAAVLAEPRTTPVPATGRGDFTRNSAWLREHRHEHRGHWVALRNGVLLATNANRAELIATLEKVGDIDGALLVKVDP